MSSNSLNILKKIVNSIFSIKNTQSHKIITFCGIRFKFANKKQIEIIIFEQLEQKIHELNTKFTVFDNVDFINKINEIQKKGVVQYYRDKGAKIGKNARFIIHPNPWDIPDFGSEPYFIEIGDDVCISFGCTFLTHDAGVHLAEKLYNLNYKIFKYGKIKIGNNCFIGCKCTILPNVTIGNNCIVGASSVVTKNIPDGEVWAGNPARFISKTEDYLAKNMQLFKESKQQELYKYMLETRGQL